MGVWQRAEPALQFQTRMTELAEGTNLYLALQIDQPQSTRTRAHIKALLLQQTPQAWPIAGLTEGFV